MQEKPTANGVRVLLADDHRAVREGLRALLERAGLDVIAEAADGRAAVDAAVALHPDVAVLDLVMPVLNGVDAAREIARNAPDTSCILLTGLGGTRLAVDALESGVRGFVTKGQGSEGLIEAIRVVATGGVYLSPDASRTLVEAHRARGAPLQARLSPREREVARLVAEGNSTKDIATLLSISVKTAEFHRGRILEKLHVRNTAGLVRYAIREGLIVP
ncbi:MAG TPA: response regulator transcription factor [Gemmatimonadales bacterium]|nr:response regulator transcription factor [Gemmatimonadales bacterium]